MSVRDDPVLFLQGGKGTTAGGGTVMGGNAITTTKAHKLDGPEHSAADDTTTLDSSTDRHGLLPKLSGDADDALRGDGTWAPAVAGVIVQDEGTPLATAGTTLDFVGAGVAATGTGATKTVTVTAELPNEGGQSTIFPHGSMGSTETFDPTDGNVHTGTLNADCTFTLSAPSGAGAALLELEITASGTHAWTFPGSVTWLSGVAPTPPASGLSKIILLRSLDGGSTWLGIEVGGSSGPDLTAIDFLVGTASGDLSAEIVVGTTPGGELGGTWPSPTVDTTHSGSSHAATQAAAEATAAAALAAHVASTSTGLGGEHTHVAGETHLSDGSTTTYTLDEAFEPGSVEAWNTTTLAYLTVTETQPDQAVVSAAGSAGDKITFSYAASLA